jgi:hypothetical protein
LRNPTPVHGVIELEAEYWTKTKSPWRVFRDAMIDYFMVPALMLGITRTLKSSTPFLARYSETYQVISNPRTGDILARKTKGRRKPITELPHHYTVQSEGTMKKCVVWSNASLTCSPTNNAGELLLTSDNNNGSWHIGIGIISTLLRHGCDVNFEAVNFRNIGEGWFGEGIPEGWAVEKSVVQKRNAMRTESEGGKVVWKVKTDIEEMVRIKWDAYIGER